jgi:hypothetical protein
MFPQTSLFHPRYAGGVANLMRSRMRSIPTVALRVPSAANARLSGGHYASTHFLTIGKAVSMGLLGIVRVYIHIPLSLPVCFGPAWPIALRA